MKRLAIYEDFQQKKRAVLFATDIAARGLDFQKSPLSWVVQFDCPDTRRVTFIVWVVQQDLRKTDTP